MPLLPPVTITERPSNAVNTCPPLCVGPTLMQPDAA
jgi:hypothetical protein